MGKALIEVKNLKVHFKQKSSRLFSLKPDYLKAVDDVNFTIAKGETFGLVGESGSGKSTIGKAILRYYHTTGGEIYYEGNEIGRMKESELQPYRKKMQSVFQDPYSSLDPSRTVREIICEPMEIHKMYTSAQRKDRADELIEIVGLKKADLLKYPHEFSGGQRQRISIARALSINPEFVVCDEPISALDVSLQAQIIHMLENLQYKYGLTYLFISHQLQVVQKMCDNIGVLYLGNMLEISSSKKIYREPMHPYTKMLISSILVPDPRVNMLDNIIIETGIQSRVITGCKFQNRCPHCTQQCKTEVPKLVEAKPEHFVACHLYD